jgi:hypothetical protein
MMMTSPHNEPRAWRLVRQTLAWAMLAGAVIAFAEVAVIIWHGGPWTWNRWFHALNPYSRLLAGTAALIGGYVLRRGCRNTAGEWGRVALRLLLLAFSVAVTCLAAEVVLRVYLKWAQDTQSIERLEQGPSAVDKLRIRSNHPLSLIIQRSRYPSVVYELKPNIDREFGHRLLRTNSQGLRESREYDFERRTNSVRIVGIGSSGMWGWECPQDEDFLSVLETNLNRRANGVLYEVLNMAVPGYNTQLEVETLRWKGLQYKPDIVILGWSNADFHLPFFFPQECQWTRRDMSFLHYFLFNRLKFQEVTQRQIQNIRKFDEDQIPGRVRQGLRDEGVRRSLKGLLEMSRKAGFKVFVVGNMNADAVKIMQDLGLPYFNIRERIGLDQYPEEYAVHAMHPRAGGHRVIAECLERELDARGWLAPRP